MSEQIERKPSHEWTKFIVLTVILVGTILVVALIRPYIFNHLVPAIMGEGQLSAPMPAENSQPAPPPAVENPAADAYPTDSAAPDNAAESAYPADNAGETKEGDGETAVPPLTHIVQPGETLYQIARTHHVSVDDIVAANNLSNPNHIEVGAPLLIPAP